MELILWRWSLGIQLASVAMVTILFSVLSQSMRRAELRSWVRAFSADLVAIFISLAYWNFQPQGHAFQVVAGGYMASKTVFILLLFEGAALVPRPALRFWSWSVLFPLVLLYSLTAFLLPSVTTLGLVHNAVMVPLFLYCGYRALRVRGSGLGWFAGAYIARSLLSLVEAFLFGVALRPPASVSPGLLAFAGSFLAVHSFFDTGAEWLLALGCGIALSDKVQKELRQYTDDLLASQEHLRRLADRDPLTALANRRCLPEVFREVQPRGALLLFFDLDGFKTINDQHGHLVGDACLQRFAAHLQECFRPGDAVLRYAGDEFLVVSPGLDARGAEERVQTLRSRLRSRSRDDVEVSFSVGVAELQPGGQPEAARRAADNSMYETRARR